MLTTAAGPPGLAPEQAGAGLAKRAGTIIYGGCSDAQTGVNLSVTDAKFFQRILLTGMKKVHEDIAWQFGAYHIGGIEAMKYLADEGEIDGDVELAWEETELAKLGPHGPHLMNASRALARREQGFVLLQEYDNLNRLTVLNIPIEGRPVVYI